MCSVWFWAGLGWSRLVSLRFVWFCWFWAGLAAFCEVVCGFGFVSAQIPELSKPEPQNVFYAGFVLVSAGLCGFRCFVLVLRWTLLVSAGLCRPRLFVLFLAGN